MALRSQHAANKSHQSDGFDRLVMHYDAQLRAATNAPNVAASTSPRHPALEELRAAIADLRRHGSFKDGPALKRFARAWTAASRYAAFLSLRHRPAKALLH